jgi:hypothetical protein
MRRVFFDINAGTDAVGYLLWFPQSHKDMTEFGEQPEEGMDVVLYSDEIEFRARLKYDDELKAWRGIPEPQRIID